MPICQAWQSHLSDLHGSSTITENFIIPKLEKTSGNHLVQPRVKGLSATFGAICSQVFDTSKEGSYKISLNTFTVKKVLVFKASMSFISIYTNFLLFCWVEKSLASSFLPPPITSTPSLSSYERAPQLLSNCCGSFSELTPCFSYQEKSFA